MTSPVVSAPTSTRAEPNSLSSSVNEASAAAICSSTMSATIKPARFTALIAFCRRGDRAGDNMNLDCQPRADHAHRIVDPVLIVNDELLRQAIDNFTSSRKLNRASGVDRAAHVLAE